MIIPGILDFSDGNTASARSFWQAAGVTFFFGVLFVATFYDKYEKLTVREMYLTSKSIVLAQENARNFRAEMSKSKNPAASLAASAKGAVVKSVPLFSLDAQPKENAQQIVQLATQTMNGQLSQQVSTPEGIFMVFVAKRIQPDAKELDKEETRFTAMYKRGKSYAVTDSFSTWIGRNIVNYTQGKD